MKLNRSLLLCALLIVVTGCDMLDMYDQRKFKTYGKSDFFDDKRQSRPPVEGAVARGSLRTDEKFFTGAVGGKVADTFPFSLTRDEVRRGRERFNIFCSPCHGQTGQGNGMIVQRGFSKPPTFHSDDMRSKTPGHFYQVITNGIGSMPSYAAQVEVRDRWLIAAYIRALQASQNTKASDLTEEARAKLDAPEAPAPHAEEEKK